MAADPEHFLDIMEERRAQADRFAWAVPAVVIAVQGILLTIAVEPDTSSEARVVAALAALLASIAAWHHFEKQAFHFALYEAVIKRERASLELPLTDRNSLLEHADTLDPRFQRTWLRGGAPHMHPDGFYEPRWYIMLRAVWVWRVVFLLLILVDLAVLAWGLGADDLLGLFGNDDEMRRPWWRADDD